MLAAQVAAEIDYRWLKAAAYPRHQAIASTFDDLLGHGHQIAITFSGLNSQPDLLTILKLYDALSGVIGGQGPEQYRPCHDPCRRSGA